MPFGDDRSSLWGQVEESWKRKGRGSSVIWDRGWRRVAGDQTLGCFGWVWWQQTLRVYPAVVSDVRRAPGMLVLTCGFAAA